MPQDKLLIHCPVRGPLPFAPCPEEEIEAVIEHLTSNKAVDQALAFPRGTHLPDGRLDLCKQNLGPDGCRRIANALNGNEFVRSLLLGTNGIGDSGANDIGVLLRSNTNLEVLYLGCNGITAEGVQILVEPLYKNQHLTGLWLKRNPIGDKGVEAIAKLIANHKSLKVLDLVNCGFGRRGMKSLCSALQNKDCPIERLYLGGNGLDAEDAIELSKVLSRNDRLKSVYLNVGAIGDRGTEAIAKTMERNQNLLELGMASNGISHHGLKSLLPSVIHNRTLRSLDLGYGASTKILAAKPNSFGDESTKLISRLLQYNQTLRYLNLARTGISKSGREILETAIATNCTIQRCVIDGGWSQSIRSHLQANQIQELADSAPEEVRLIRSVYRTQQRKK